MKQNVYDSNSYYQGLIQNFYAGAKGCFSAFMHFFYQFNQCEIFYPEYSSCFKTLYNLEIENCRILSQILIKMGGDNKYYSNSRKFLSGYNVDYIKNISQIVYTDIEFLECNIIEVKSIISKIENFSIKSCLLEILENKKKALKILKENSFKNNLI